MIVDVRDFSLAAGQQLALRGESGSGKTTFLHLVAGILAPDSGSILLNGRDMAALGEPARDRLRAENIGYIFQTFTRLQGYSCRENVLLGMAFGVGADRAHATAMLGRVGLGHRLDHRPAPAFHRPAAARGGRPRPGQPSQARSGRRAHGQPRPQKCPRGAQAHPAKPAAQNGAALLLVSHDPEVLSTFEDACRISPDLSETLKGAAS